MSLAKKVLNALALTIAILFTLVVVLTTGELFFGSSKIKPLFGMTPNGPPDNPTFEARTMKRDAGVRPPTYFNATKSAPINFPLSDSDGGL